jgi:hypothetical protein
MTRDEPKRQHDCKVLQFRLRDVADRQRERAADNAGRDIGQLLDLSRYEESGKDADEFEFKDRMVQNVAAVVVLSVFVAFAAFDVIRLEQIQHCIGGCGPH